MIVLLLVIAALVGIGFLVRAMIASDAERAKNLPPFINHIDDIASKFSAAEATPQIAGSSWVLEPHVFWQLGPQGDGKTGSIANLVQLTDPNASPVWTANSVIFFKETTSYDSFGPDGNPNRETTYLSAWIVNLKTGESTGFYLGAPQTLNITKDGRFPLPNDTRDIFAEMNVWFRSIKHVAAPATVH